MEHEKGIVEQAFIKAKADKLDLSVKRAMAPIDPFTFVLLQPTKSVMSAFNKAKVAGLPWPKDVPNPILTYHKKDRTYAIMDGMMRICAAKLAGYESFPAFVANGDTYEALEEILDQGYYGEDFVELLCLANPEVKSNQERVNRNRLAGL